VKAVALALLALGGCVIYVDDGPCGPAPACANVSCDACAGEVYVCNEQTGDWVQSFCEPAPVEVHGTITLDHDGESDEPPCLASIPHDVALVVAGDELTAEAPIVIVESFVGGSRVTATLEDDWGNGVTPMVTYDLDAYDDQTIDGTMAATVGDCTDTYWAQGTWGDS
jgi:hypothetical protein